MIEDAEFARRIRAARAYLGLNLNEAGKEMGLSSHQLSRRERADKKPMRMTVRDRLKVMEAYMRLTGWPRAFFTDETMPSIPLPEELGGELSPADVVGLVELADPDDDGGTASQP
jgi:transcriptional regulator with XRE-family HTH domain